MTDQQMDDLSRSLGSNPFGHAIRGLIAEAKALRKENATLKADRDVMAQAFADYGEIEQPALGLARKEGRGEAKALIQSSLDGHKKNADNNPEGRMLLSYIVTLLSTLCKDIDSM